MLAVSVGAIVIADLGMARDFFVWFDRQPGGDKTGHFLLFGLLAFTLNCALHGRMVLKGGRAVQLGSLIIAVAITIEEFSQWWIPVRKFDLGDLLANYAGIACADWLARRWLR